jgi:hypothetical protein
MAFPALWGLEMEPLGLEGGGRITNPCQAALTLWNANALPFSAIALWAMLGSHGVDVTA